MKCPCYKCDKRTEICHAICGDYKAFRSELDEKNHERAVFLIGKPKSHDKEMKYRQKLKKGARA